MAMQNKGSDFEEQFQLFLEEAVERVKSEEDPIVLSQYRKLFKKNVPFALRSYVATFLAKEMLSRGFSLSKGRRPSTRTNRYEKPAKTEIKSENFSKTRPERSERTERSEKLSAVRTEKESTPFTRITIDEDKATTIFIGMGRNRGVYARDVIGLITQRASIERERIGEIKILDNYSFVQVYLEDADKIIELTNGTDYRNRKLAVSYAHKKDNEEITKKTEETDSVAE